VIPRFALGRRVVIVGDSCSGKSTLGEDLAERLVCPFIELDALYWKPGWTPSEIPPFRARVDEATQVASWVLAGNYESVRDITWPRADTVVWLDFPLRVTWTRIFTRSYRRWRSRELLWGTNRERFFTQFKIWDQSQSLFAWNFHQRATLRQRYQQAERDPANGHLVFHRLASPAAVRDWVERLADVGASPGAGAADRDEIDENRERF
jgi:adenylate kinase family enzyme